MMKASNSPQRKDLERVRQELIQLTGIPRISNAQARVYRILKREYKVVLSVPITRERLADWYVKTHSSVGWMVSRDIVDNCANRDYCEPAMAWMKSRWMKGRATFTQSIANHLKYDDPAFFLVGFANEDDALLFKLSYSRY